MRLHPAIRNIIIEITCGLYTLLFVYAATSKLLDFENFRVQIGQSPILGAFAGILAWLVPSLEILFSIFLWVPRLRIAALFCCYTLMLMFTGYIFIVLNYSSYIPCSCGGVLEHMNWTAHLYFNLFFVILAALAIILSPQSIPLPRLKILKWMSVSTITGLMLIVALHLLSNDIIHQQNTFIRRFTFSPPKVHEADLGYNSYYIAGSSENEIFLGNFTVPLLLEAFDSSLKKRTTHRLTLDTIYPNITPHLHVADLDFYVTDGNIPVIYKGKTTGGWKAKKIWNGNFRFSHIQFTDSTLAAVRGYAKDGQSLLAIIDLFSPDARLKEGLLQRQIDGIFDVDGLLLYDSKGEEVIYAHAYKNQLIITDKQLSLKRRNTTIDTVSKPQIKVARLKKTGDRMLSAPPLTVNHGAAADNGYIFVHSGLMGRFESKLMWKEASIIDVYESKSNRYLFSFYVHHINGKKLRSFIVKRNHFYGLIGNQLVDYQLQDAMFSAK